MARISTKVHAFVWVAVAVLVGIASDIVQVLLASEKVGRCVQSLGLLIRWMRASQHTLRCVIESPWRLRARLPVLSSPYTSTLRFISSTSREFACLGLSMRLMRYQLRPAPVSSVV